MTKKPSTGASLFAFIGFTLLTIYNVTYLVMRFGRNETFVDKALWAITFIFSFLWAYKAHQALSRVIAALLAKVPPQEPKMRLYIAGPMRGIPFYNHPAFDEAATKLRNLGYEVFSPAEHDRNTGMHVDAAGDANIDVSEALLADLTWICRHADGIVLLPGWANSNGAIAEAGVAVALGKPGWLLDDFIEHGVLAPSFVERYMEDE